MRLYGGIDLHSNNNVVALTDETDRIVYRKRLPNNIETVLAALAPYRDEITGVVVESTYNWYWLVDALMEADYRVHLANTAAIIQYSGLKYADDDTDAAWLGKLLRLGLLPEGYIYPKAERAVRDLLRRRQRLVQQHTANILAVQNLFSRNRGRSISANEVRRLTPESVAELVADPNLALAIQGTVLAMGGQQAAIELLEREAWRQTKERQNWRALQSVSGKGNTKNGNKYLAWAYVEAANFAVRYNPQIKRYYQRKRAKTKSVIATKAVAHKLARACYHMLRDGSEFDVNRAFA